MLQHIFSVDYVCALPSDGEGESEEQGPNEATTADADTLESLADIDEALEKLGQARNLIKAADSKVHMSGMITPSSMCTTTPPPSHITSCPSHPSSLGCSSHLPEVYFIQSLPAVGTERLVNSPSTVSKTHRRAGVLLGLASNSCSTVSSITNLNHNRTGQKRKGDAHKAFEIQGAPTDPSVSNFHQATAFHPHYYHPSS